MNVIPAILPHSFEELTDKLSRVEGLALLVQIDFCDGVFGRERTWLPEGGESLSYNLQYEFDIMVNDWRTCVAQAIALDAARIVVHVDMFTDQDMSDLVAMLEPKQIPLGVSVSNDKTVDFHEEMIRKAQSLYPHVYIQVMGIRTVGEQGQAFDETTPERIIALKKVFGSVPLQVDGSMTPETAKHVCMAGAETVIAGSYIFGGEDAGGAIERLEEAVCSK